MKNVTFALLLLVLIGLSITCSFAQTKKNIPTKKKISTIIPAKKTINLDSIFLLKMNIHQKDSFMVMKYTRVPKSGNFMTKKEIEVIQFINVARMYPLWFIVFAELQKPQTENEISLVNLLKKMKTIPNPLKMDSLNFISAKCHAISSGKIGYVGHDRHENCKSNFYGECCDYGNESALEIVKSLLIDEGVPSLGHRKICLDSSYTKIGVSIQPHIKYRSNAVLDFSY